MSGTPEEVKAAAQQAAKRKATVLTTLVLVGFLSLIVGSAEIFRPLGFIVGGVELISLAYIIRPRLPRKAD